MKTVFTFFVLFVSVGSFGQKRGDNKIVVTVSDTSDLFRRVALVLVDKGYSLDKKDKELGYITTEPKKLTKWRPEMKITAQIRDSRIILSGFADTKGKLAVDGLHSSGTFDPIVYASNGSIMSYCWNELVDLGKKLGTLSFTK